MGESQVPRDACRWLIENEQEKQIKVTLHELTSDCRDSEDEIYLLNAKRSVFGPFCAPVEKRHRRETEVNLEHEVKPFLIILILRLINARKQIFFLTT